MEPSTVFLIAD